MKKIGVTIALITCVFVCILVFVSAYLISNKKTDISPRSTKAAFSANNNYPSATLDEYWNGHGEWKLFRKDTLTDHPDWNAGFTTQARVYPYRDSWLLVSRKVDNNGPKCPNGNTLTTEIRTSSDKGNTYSAPVEMVTADIGTPWECAVTDGSLFYEKNRNIWYFLAQCLARDGIWNGCVFERKGNPYGKFSTVRNNPIIRSGNLWSKICLPGTDCSNIAESRRITDEGTFEIFDYRKPYFYVSFHGFANPYGFRGMAKTTDFTHWITSARDLPTDAILDAYDLKNWREQWISPGPIGVGNVSMLRQGKYYYALAEGNDINLACMPGQNWDIGLFRSPILTNTHWEQLPAGNPIFYSSQSDNPGKETLPCNIQYAALYQDGNDTYMSFTRTEANWDYRGLYIYKLAKTGNLLQNADFWKCSTENWNRTEPNLSLTALRQPDKASDGNCTLSIHCNNDSCSPTDSAVYQDVPVPTGTKTVSFGGKVAIDSAIRDGKANLVLWELGRNKPIAHEIRSETLKKEFSELSQTVSLHPDTKMLRYSLYILEKNSRISGYRMDETYITAR